MTEDNRQDAIKALAHWRDESLADWLTVLIGIAAERNPEALRTALAQVFDLGAVEKQTDFIYKNELEARRAASQALEECVAVRELLRAIDQQLDATEARIDRMHERFNREMLAMRQNGVKK